MAVIRSTKSDIAWNYAGTLFSMGINFMLLPIYMACIPGDQLGLWYIFTSIGSISQLFDFGFNPTIARNVAYCWSGLLSLKSSGIDREHFGKGSSGDSALNTIIATSRALYRLISVAASSLLFTVGLLYIIYISNRINHLIIISSYTVYSLSIIINIYFGYYAILLRGVGAVKELNKITVISRAIQIVVAVSLLIADLGLLAASFAYLSYGVAYRICCMVAIKRNERLHAGYNYSKLTNKSEIKECFRVIWGNAWRDGLVTVASFLSNQAATIVCSLFLSLSQTGVYSISMQLATAVATISQSYYTSQQPSLQSAFANSDWEYVISRTNKSMRIYTYVFLSLSLVLLTFGLPLLHIIKPSYQFDYWVMICILVYFYILYRTNTVCSMISNANVVPYSRALVTWSAAGVLMSFIVCYLGLEIWGLVISPLLMQCVYNAWHWEIYYKHDVLNI